MLLFKLTFTLLIFYGNPLAWAADEDLNTYDELGKTVAELVRLRGFKAENHYVTTTDGYILNLVEIINPLISSNYTRDSNKLPVLFIHGLFTNGKSFLIDSTKSKPNDYSGLNVSSLSFDELEDLLGGDPTTNCMPLLLSNFARRVFILNRRGGYESQGHINPDLQPFSNPLVNVEQALIGGIAPRSIDYGKVRRKRDVNPEIYQPILGFLSFIRNPPKINLTNVGNLINPRYWNYSIDEQAQYDVPNVMEYILNQTGSDKLSIVGHSAGATLTLMSLINYPDLTDKLSTTLLWAPALYSEAIRYRIVAPFVLPELMAFLGPVPPDFVAQLGQDLLAPICSSELSASTLCNAAVDILFGYAGDQQKVYPGTLTAALDSFSAHDYVSVLQTAFTGKQHKYDYYDSRRNQIAYGQASPPLYDVRKIKSKTLSFWSSANDGLVPEESVKRIVADLRVPSRQTYINQEGVLFNHISYFTHPRVASLINIPGLQQLES